MSMLSVSLLLILLAVACAVWRCFSTPSLAERLLAIQLIGTASVMLCLLLKLAWQQSALVDVALLLALLAIAMPLTFSEQMSRPSRQKRRQDHD